MGDGQISRKNMADEIKKHGMATLTSIFIGDASTFSSELASQLKVGSLSKQNCNKTLRSSESYIYLFIIDLQWPMVQHNHDIEAFDTVSSSE